MNNQVRFGDTDFHAAILDTTDDTILDLTYGQFDKSQRVKTYTRKEFEKNYDIAAYNKLYKEEGDGVNENL